MKRFFSLALAVGIWAIFPTTSFSQSSQIGVTDLGDVTHSVAFRQVMKMLGNWEGKLYQSDGSPVETSTNFKRTSTGYASIETLTGRWCRQYGHDIFR